MYGCVTATSGCAFVPRGIPANVERVNITRSAPRIHHLALFESRGFILDAPLSLTLKLIESAWSKLFDLSSTDIAHLAFLVALNLPLN